MKSNLWLAFAAVIGLVSCQPVTQDTPTKKTPSTVKETVADHKELLKQVGFDGVANIQRFDQLVSSHNLNKKEVKGLLNVEFNDFDHTQKYFINTDNNIEHVEILNEDRHTKIGKEVTFRGVSDSKNSSPGYIIATELHNSSRGPFKHEPVKMLVMLFNFSGNKLPKIQLSEIESEIFGGIFNNFYSQISESRLHHVGRVSGWHTINRPESTINGMICRVTVDEIKNAARDSSINLAQYDVVTYVTNCPSYSTIGGRTHSYAYDVLGINKSMFLIEMASNPNNLEFNYPSTPRNRSGLSSILIHERGHNFGLGHSNGLDCGEEVIAAGCKSHEYGNYDDRMGWGRDGFYFNASQLVDAGFRSPNEILHIQANGVYEIDHLQASPSKTRKIAAYIKHPVTGENLYMLEYRRAEGFDVLLGEPHTIGTTRGVMFYTLKRPNNTSGSFYQAVILDPNPTTEPWDSDIQGESLQGTYEDIYEGVKIQFISINEVTKKAKFKVTFDPESSPCNEPLNLNSVFSSLYATSTERKEGGTVDNPGSISDDFGKGKKQEDTLYYHGQTITVLKGDNLRILTSGTNNKNPRCEFPIFQASEMFSMNGTFLSRASGLWGSFFQIGEHVLNDGKNKYTIGNYNVDEYAQVGDQLTLKYKIFFNHDPQNFITKEIKIKIGTKRSGSLATDTLESVDHSIQVQ